MKLVDKHLNSAKHQNAVRQHVMMSQLQISQPINSAPVVERGSSDMELDHTWAAQDSFDTELHFPQVIQPEYVIRDDDDVGFGSDSSGGHEAPSEYSDEFLSWDMFGESIIEQREEAINLAKAQDTRQTGGAPKVNWDPFNSEEDLIACLIMGYLHTLMSRVTYLQLRIILKMKKLALPYWDAVRNSRERIRKLLNFVNKESISVWDNKIFHISVKGILTNELLNPYVNGHLEFYPHDPCGNPIDSLCQSFKWREDLARDIRVQMVHIESKHFYIYEPTQLKSGEVVIPTFFYKAKGKLYAKCYSPEFMPHETGDAFDIIIPADIKFTETHHQRVVDINNFDKVYSEISEIPMGDGTYITIKIGDNLYEEDNSGKRIQIELPNPWRKKAQNCIIRHVPLTLYADDTSGNCSKQWNKHISYYFTLSGLHPHWSNQEYNCQFVATSNVASCLELADPIIEEINDMSINGHFAYDSILNQRVLIMSFVLGALGDSPMHAEMTSTPMPANANSPCRMCQLLVVRKEDKSLVAYVKDFFRLTTGGHVPPPPRKWEETISSIKKCWQESKDEAKTAYDDKTKAKGLKDNINVEFVERYHQRNKPGQKEEIEAIEKECPDRLYNRFYTLKGFDGCKDTPVEILHVLQLGIIRYLLRDFMEGLGEVDRRKLEGK
ncbi:hypothetical protein PTTG_29842 [Puccinia triticina 1-1 BBBD Race 1]|uniref:Uncharacterized protein n=1 Tax=Puccinia triticina (isolate 1-1 / race 1 (BBBD)) TaxID=630390 RepID=A0A180G1H3_PUCT1|nr:hypothetical protein PTTG_29842 [Puccinia triticina 1-1 BBBD Race 1]